MGIMGIMGENTCPIPPIPPIPPIFFIAVFIPIRPHAAALFSPENKMLVLIQETSSAWFGGRNGAVLQFHVHRTFGYVRVLDGFLHSHGLVAVLLSGFVTQFLLP